MELLSNMGLTADTIRRFNIEVFSLNPEKFEQVVKEYQEMEANVCEIYEGAY